MAALVDGCNESLYLQVRRTVAERIERGEYSAGSALPSENELAAEFGIARLTVRAAVDELVERGLVRRVQGKGVYVADPLFEPEDEDRGGFRETARAMGKEPSVRLLARSRRYAGDYYGWLFGVDAHSLLYSLRRLNIVGDIPVSIENTLIPLELFPTIEEVDIQVFSLYETYGLLGHRVASAQEKLDIAELSARDAGLLRVEAGTPALALECVSYDAAGQALEYVKSFHRGDAGGYTFSF